MALQTTGPISLNNVNQELGKASPYNQQVSLNDSDVRALLGVASGQIALSNAYGKNNYLNTTVYVMSGAVSTFTVPAGVTSLLVKMWGGGGGGGGTGYTSASGAGGGYISGYVDVTPGQQFTVGTFDSLREAIVLAENCDGCDPENGNVPPCRAPTRIAPGGVAGRLWQNNNLYMIAGGGGGAMNYGGGGGGGGSGAAPAGFTGGGGASGSTGGTAGTSNATYPADNGIAADNNGTVQRTQTSTLGGQFVGGYDTCAGEGTGQSGARGGDGYASGGAGAYSGGGGSSGHEGFTGVTTIAAAQGGVNSSNPANTSDPNYSNISSAGIGQSANIGGPARIVIRY